MLQAFFNIFRIPDLRKKVLFTMFILVVYRIGFFIPLVGIDQTALRESFQETSEGGTGINDLLQYASMFTGGDFGQSTIFGLGIMPYITAAIIFQLLQSAVPRLQELKKEGATGQQKITEWTRYTTVGLCLIQGFMWMRYMDTQGFVTPFFQVGNGPLLFYASGLTALTAGSIFLMWLGEQIDKFGIGNGVSLILTAGIIAGMPNAIQWVVQNTGFSQQDMEASVTMLGAIFLAVAFVFVVAGAVLITVAQRRIPIQQAKHIRAGGRRVLGGQKHYLPLRVNHAGVMPIIFATSLMIFPSVVFRWMSTRAQGGPEWWAEITTFLAQNFQMGSFPYIFAQILMIYFFSYFWTTVQFSPEDMAKQLRDSGSFIPGLRPGPRTAEYLETVMTRITYVGAGFLAIIAIIPELVATRMGIPFTVASFLGGTGLLIVVSVGLDLMQRIEANLLMRNYAGFLSNPTGRGGAKRIRGPRG